MKLIVAFVLLVCFTAPGVGLAQQSAGDQTSEINAKKKQRKKRSRKNRGRRRRPRPPKEINYQGKILAVAGDKAVINVDPKQARVGDIIMVYDEYLVEKGSAEIIKRGAQKDRVMISLPPGGAAAGYSYSFVRRKGAAQPLAKKPLKFYAEGTPQRPSQEQLDAMKPFWMEMVLGSASLSIASQGEETPTQIASVFAARLINNLQLAFAWNYQSVGGFETSRAALGLIVNYSLGVDKLNQKMFTSLYYGSQKSGSVNLDYQRLNIGLRVKLFERVSYRPYLFFDKVAGEDADLAIGIQLFNFGIYFR